MKRLGNPILSAVYILVAGLWLLGAHLSVLAFLAQPAGQMKEALAPAGVFSLAIYIVLCLAGLGAVYATLTGRASEAQFVRQRPSFRWTALSTLALYLVAVFILIYQPGLRPLLLSWFTPLFLAGWVLAVKAAARFDGGIRLQALTQTDALFGGILFVMLLALSQIKLAMPPSIFWKIAFLGMVALNGTIAAMFALAQEAGPRYWNNFSRFFKLRRRFRIPAYILAMVLVVVPTWWMFYYDVTGIGAGVGFRLEVVLLISFLVSILIEPGEDRLTGLQSMLLATGLTGYVMMVGSYFTQVTNYPFALSWSEGNRLYDNSLIFAKNLYTYSGQLNPNYFSPGRYGLWGLTFLIPGAPIWIHRLWGAIIACVPGLLLGWVLTPKVKDLRWRLTAMFGITLFLNQGPIYNSLTIALLILALGARSKLLLRILAVVVGSYYAGISRFTWVLVTAAWAGLFDLFLYYPSRQGNWFKRLLPAGGMILLGLVPGMIFSWPEVMASQGETISSQSSNLLTYRLLPSSTYPLGVGPGLVVATIAAILFLTWLLVKKFWRMDIWQAIASGVVMAGFLYFGLIASSKIGGGSNLHNMDMFLCTLVLLFSFAILNWGTFTPTGNTSTTWTKALLMASMIIPAWASMWSGGPLVVPSQAESNKVISQIQTAANEALPKGEVLFMDERQLLTFGRITDIPLVADYEKKFMMDQAMAGNQPYFEQFYADLRAKRFSLIISETQKLNYQSDKDDFNEENNAWVKWVSEPFLTYYQPITTFKDFGFTLYVPK
jgi:hypothetical protein